MTPRNALPQSVLQRHLQTLMDRTAIDQDVGISAVLPKSQESSFPQVHRESSQDVNAFEDRLLGVDNGLIAAILSQPQDRSLPKLHCESSEDVDKFRGRLLGVEDGLIDAIVSEPSPGHPSNQRMLRSSTLSPWYSQAKSAMRPTRLPGSRNGLDDTLALPAEQDPTALGSPQTSETAMLHPSLPLPAFDTHRRCSIADDDTAAHHIWCTCAIASDCNDISGDDSDSDGTFTSCAWRSIDDEHTTNEYGTPTTPSCSIPPPSTGEWQFSEAKDTQTDSDCMIVDSIMLEKSADDLSLGTWDLSNWRTLEFTMSELLVVSGLGDGR